MAKEGYASALRAEQETLVKIAARERREIESACDRAIYMRREAERVPEWDAEMLITLCRTRLDGYARKHSADLAATGFFRRWVWPSPFTIALERAHAEIELGLATLGNLDGSKAACFQAQLFPHLARYGVAESIVREEMRLAEAKRQELERSFREFIHESEVRLADTRVKAFRRLADVANQTIADLQRTIRPFVQRYSSAAGQLRIELDKLGIG